MADKDNGKFLINETNVGHGDANNMTINYYTVNENCLKKRSVAVRQKKLSFKGKGIKTKKYLVKLFI